MAIYLTPKLRQLEFNKSASKVPLILINTENFDWKALRDARLVFVNARLETGTQETPLVTELMTIKVFQRNLFPSVCAELTVVNR